MAAHRFSQLRATFASLSLSLQLLAVAGTPPPRPGPCLVGKTLQDADLSKKTKILVNIEINIILFFLRFSISMAGTETSLVLASCMEGRDSKG